MMNDFWQNPYAYILIISVFVFLIAFAFVLDQLKNKKRKQENKLSTKEEDKILKKELEVIAKIYFVIAAVQEITTKHQQKVESNILNTKVAKLLNLIMESEDLAALKVDVDKYVAMSSKIAKLANCDCELWTKKVTKELNFFQRVYLLNSNVTKPVLQKFSKEYKRFIFNF